MQSINNFENMLEILGRNFEDLQMKLAAIPSPAKIIKIEREPTGKYYAVLMLDRPSESGKRSRGRPAKVEVVDTSVNQGAGE